MAPINPPSADELLSRIENLLIRAIEPTRTLLSAPALVQRQAGGTVTVVAVDGDGVTTTSSDDDNDPDDAQTLSGGAIAGIVIGSIAGFLLLVWIIRSCTNLGLPPGASHNPKKGAWYDGVREEQPPPRSRSRHSHHSHHHHRRSGSQVREVPVAVVRQSSPRAPPYVYEADRGRRERRSRSRGDRY